MTHLVPQSTSELTSTAAAGVAWSVAQRWVMRVTGFATVAILTRLLSPEDFGTVTIAMAVLPLIYLLADMGFGTYIVQSDDASQRTLSTVFWYSTGAGLALAGALAVAAPLVGHLLGVPGATPIIYGFTPMVVVVTIGSVPNALLTRRMQFRTIAIRSVAAGLASQVLAVILAFAGFGAWALVAQSVASQVISLAFTWPASRWLPSFQFSVSEFKRVARFGFNVVGVEVIAMLRLWAENAIIVAALGVTGLGYLNMAQRLIQTAQDLTAAAILPVSTVVFSKVRDTVDRLRSGYFSALGITYMTVIPIMVALLVGAPRLVPTLFGDQWNTSVAPAQALALAGIMTVAAMLDQGLLYGSGRPGRWLAYAVAIDAATLVTTAVFVRWGLIATSLGFAGIALVATVARWMLVGGVIGAPFWRVAQPFARASLAIALSAGAGFIVGRLTSALPSIVALALMTTAVLTVHLVVMRLFMPAEFSRFIGLAHRTLGRIGRGLPRPVPAQPQDRFPEEYR